ncbi:PfkB family carbohydrate kinase [Chloroflexota bacterium]
MHTDSKSLSPIDYLVIGHLACDRVSTAINLGGTASYASLTARALGHQVGVVTAWAGEIPLDPLEGIQVYSIPTERSTIFENIYTPSGRKQIIHHQANPIDYGSVPEMWKKSSIIHLGPIAHELEVTSETGFSTPFIGLTPQGWMREWDRFGNISPRSCPDLSPLMASAGAMVISIEDVGGDEDEIERLSLENKVLAVTEGFAGSRLYWNQDMRRFTAPEVEELDASGAGDIFAAAFFIRLYTTRDPWEAARFATRIASTSVTRMGLNGIPSSKEIKTALMEVM